MSEKMVFRNSAFILFIWKGMYLIQLKQERGKLKYHPCGGKADEGESPLQTINRERKEEISFEPDFVITDKDYLCSNIYEMNDLGITWKQKFFFKTLSDEQVLSMKFGDVKNWVLLSPEAARSMTIDNATMAMLGLFEVSGLKRGDMTHINRDTLRLLNS